VVCSVSALYKGYFSLFLFLYNVQCSLYCLFVYIFKISIYHKDKTKKTNFILFCFSVLHRILYRFFLFIISLKDTVTLSLTLQSLFFLFDLFIIIFFFFSELILFFSSNECIYSYLKFLCLIQFYCVVHQTRFFVLLFKIKSGFKYNENSIEII